MDQNDAKDSLQQSPSGSVQSQQKPPTNVDKKKEGSGSAGPDAPVPEPSSSAPPPPDTTEKDSEAKQGDISMSAGSTKGGGEVEKTQSAPSADTEQKQTSPSGSSNDSSQSPGDRVDKSPDKT